MTHWVKAAARELLPAALVAATAVLMPSRGGAQTSYPMVTAAHPVAVCRGQTAQVTVTGQENFAGAYKVLFDGEGLSAEVVKTEEKAAGTGKRAARTRVSSVELKLTAAADAALGEHEFRIITPQGASSVGQIVVVEDPVTVEKEPNDAREQAQAITVPAAIAGRVEKAEDVDHYRFAAAAGDELTFVVVSQRLEDKIHDLQNHVDPILFLYDSSGRELASGDNDFFADPMLHYRFERAGEYVLQVRDVRYEGDARWVYLLQAVKGPFVVSLFPIAGPRGASLAVQPVGYSLGPTGAAKLKLPLEWAPGTRAVRIASAEGKSNPVPLIVSDLAEIQEQEPNDVFAGATPISIPAGASGRIAREGDADTFVFEAKRGQAFTLEVEARRFWSSLDSYLAVLDAKGKELAANDDAFGKDSGLDWTAPTDGKYALQIRDLLGRGGEAFVYHLTALPAKPDFTLACDGDKANIGPGGAAAWYVAVTRRNGFAGAVKLEVKGLPPGVTADPVVIPAELSQGCLVLRAAADAKIAAAGVQVVGTASVARADGKTVEIARVAEPLEEIYFPGGGRGRFAVKMHTVAVSEHSDVVKLEVSRPEVTLHPGESVRIDVNVERSADYKGPVNLDVRLQHLGGIFGNPLPPGVTMDDSASKTLLGPSESKGHIVLRAAPTARPVRNIPFAVLANVSINFVVKVSYASPPIRLSVEPKPQPDTTKK